MSWRDDAAMHAAREYPREACGLVVASPGCQPRYMACANLADDGEHFILDPNVLAEAEDCGDTVLGVVHSHPDQRVPRPSLADLAACDAGTVPWHVLGWPSGRWVDFTPARDVPKLTGRQFAHGVTDCFAVGRDWFRLERGIVLPDYPRDDGWWDAGGNLYLDLFRDAGFEVHDGPPSHGDALLMQIRSPVPNHAAIYLDGDRILHHLGGRLSCVEPWDGALRAATKMVLRYAAA